MAWIKRNLLFVVGLVVAALLIGGGVFFMLQQMERADTAAQSLTEKNGQLEQLVGNDPYPDKKNIDLAKLEQVRLEKYRAEALGFFQTNQVPTDLDQERFQTLLLTTLVGLEREADSSGTKLPASDYAFSFSPEKGNTQIPVKQLGALAAQLADIRAISKVLFRAKIHALTSLKRTGTVTNDYGSADILTGKKPQTEPNTGAISRPYEVQFQTFSGELGEVLAGFVNAPETIIVRAVNIQKGTLPSADVAPVAAAPVMSGMGRLDPALAARYGLNRPQAPQAVAATPAPSTKVGEMVVEENPIQVTLSLDVVKLPAPGQPAPAGGKAPRTPPPAAAPANP